MKKSLGARIRALPAPVWVVGSYDEEGKPNVMTAAWGGTCCSKPPCIYVSLRKATYTYGNIMDRKAFTVSIGGEEFVEEVDYMGIASGREVDKFSVTGLTPVKSDVVDAPYVEEFPLVLECEMIRAIELGLHTQFIGEIKDVKADPSILSENGSPDIEKVKPIVWEPGNSTYHGIGKFLGLGFKIGKKLKTPLQE